MKVRTGARAMGLRMTALSLASGPGLVLPAASLMRALTVKVLPSALGSSWTVNLPAVIWVCVSSTTRTGWPATNTVTASPTAASAGRPISTVTF